jgi:hypothetical protein
MLCTLVVVLDVSRCVCIFITSTGLFTYGNGRVYIVRTKRDMLFAEESVSVAIDQVREGPPIWENSIHFLPSDSYYSFFCFLDFLIDFENST